MALNFVCQDCLGPIADAYTDSCVSCGYIRPQEGWAPDPLLGLILGGRYRLEGRLGAGGMAAVFRASRIGALGGQVAVKVLAPRFARTVIARRFEREAQVISRLTNPHIVRVYDFDVFQLPGKNQSLYYIAMELIEGTTLTLLLRKQGRVNFLWGLDVLRQIARGLDEAHTQGVVHRDLKPSNIMLIQQRGATHVKVLDFGIAGLAQNDQPPGTDGAPAERLTEMGVLSGTPDYMAPEQAAGLATAGPAADIYALGLIAYEMFSGQRPFASGGTIETLLARVQNPAPSLRQNVTDPEFPPELFRIVDKMLQKDPKARYQNAGELLDELAPFPTMQTTPDFMPPSELIKHFQTVSSIPAPSEAMARTLTSAALPKPGKPSKPGKPGKGAKGADDGAPKETPEEKAAREAREKRAQRTQARAAAEDGVELPEKRSNAWLWWIVALLVLGGAGTVVALVLTKGPGTEGGPATATQALTQAEAPDAGSPVATAPPETQAATTVSTTEVVEAPEVAAEPAPEPEPEMAPEVVDAGTAVDEVAAAGVDGAAGAGDEGAGADAGGSPVLGHAREPLEAGFTELKLVLGKELLLLGVPETMPPLFAPLEVQLGLDRAGVPLRLVGASVHLTLVRTGMAAGSVNAAKTGAGRADGRLAFALPARPLADVFAVALELTLVGGEVVRTTLTYDANAGTFKVDKVDP